MYWKKDIDFDLGQYKAHGYIGVLKEMSSQNNGFVLLRRGRVVKGAENGQRYFPKSLCGNVGSPRYKRISESWNWRVSKFRSTRTTSLTRKTSMP